MMLNEKLKIPPFIEFVKSVRTILSDWKNKTPNQKWCYIYSVGKYMAKTVAMQIFEEDQSIYWYSYCTYALAGTYITFFMYTAYYCFMHGKPEQCLPSTCALVFVLWYVPFVWSTLSKNRNKYHSLITFAGHYIHTDNHDHTEHNRICSNQLDLDAKSTFVRFVIITSSACVAIICPIYAYFTQGIKTTTIQIKVPFTEEDSTIEYAVNMILQNVVFAHGIFILFSVQLMMAMIRDVIQLSPRLIKNRLNELIQMHERNRLSEVQLRFTFKDITKQILDYEKFVIYLREFLYWRNLATPFLLTYSMAIGIFCHYKMGFLCGSGFSLMVYSQIFYICEDGQDIEDNGLDGILYDSNWHHLPRPLQKDMMYLINQRQNCVTFNVGSFSVINRNLTKSVTSKLYILILFLLNFSA